MNHTLLSISIYLIILLMEKATALESETIIGGRKADIENYPYQVALINKFSICGAGIIAENYVITAAHCVVKNEIVAQQIIIHGGVTYWHSDDDPDYDIRYNVVKIYFLRKYFVDGNEDIDADVAVMKIKEKFNFEENPKLGRLTLPWTNSLVFDDCIGKMAKLASFGIDSLDERPYFDRNDKVRYVGTSSRQLHEIDAKILSSRVCKFLMPFVTKDHFCAQIRIENSDNSMYGGTCYGDSGSPLVYENTIIGVLVIGPYDCDENMSPSAYINVSYYENFVKNALEDHCDTEFMYCVSDILPV